MVSSDVAARGIDVQDVSHVINFDIPSIPRGVYPPHRTAPPVPAKEGNGYQLRDR